MKGFFLLPAKKLANTKRNLVHLLLVFLALGLSSCFLHYYKTNSQDHIDEASVQKLVNSDKYFILHLNDKEYSLNNIKVVNESMEADLDSVAPGHSKFLYLYPRSAAHNRFPAKDKDYVLNEVHLYAKASETNTLHVIVPMKNINRVDVYELDKGPTNRSKIASIVGITLSTAALATIIVAATSTHSNTQSNSSTPPPCNSCTSNDASFCSPQVYALDNNQPELEGTLYSGAIYASLERTDYLPISTIAADSNKLRLIMKGEKNEDITVNEIKLLQVTHSDKMNALVDRKGNVLVYNKPVPPDHAMIGNGRDAKEDLIACDGRYYSFTNGPENGNSSDVVLDFKKPFGAVSGKLIIRAKNSLWSFYLFSQFKKLYGDYYQTMIEKKDKADPKNVLQCELDQSLPILVSVKQKDGWKFNDYFLTSGNAMLRDLIMQLDLSEFKNEDHVQVRLQTTYMFWDLDYAGMDFSETDSYKTSFVQASGLFKSSNAGKMDTITTAGPALQIKGSEQLHVEFDLAASPGKGLKNSYFLAGKGYYHDISRFDGKPQLVELNRFSGKGAFDKYSREKFEMILNEFRSSGSKDLLSAK